MSALGDVLEHGKHACPFQEIHAIDYVNNPSIYSWDTVKLSVRGEERVYLVLTNNMHVITVAERAETSDGRLGWAEHTVTLPESLSLGRSNSLGIAAVAAMASKKTPGSVILSFIVKVDLSGDDSHLGGSGSSSGGGGNSGATWYFVSLKVTAEDLAALPFHEAIQSAKQTYKADLMFHTPFCLLHMGGGVSDTFFLSGMDGTIHFFSETADSGAGGRVGGGGNDSGGNSGSGSSGASDVIAAPFLKDVQAKLTPEIAAVSKHAYTVSAIACVEFPLSHCRVSACGCTNGFLSVSIVDLTDMRVVKHAEAILDGPINSLEFYKHEPKRPQQVPECLLKLSERTGLPLSVLPSSPRQQQQQQTSALPRVDLLVGGILGYAMWYTNVQEGSLSECYELPLPDGVDGVTCARVVDNNLEQAPEVVVTTFSAAALGFSLAFDSPSAPPSFALKWAKRFEFPLLSLTTCNFSGGVLDDLLILGFRGCHILQCTETWERKEKAIAALDALRDIGSMSFN